MELLMLQGIDSHMQHLLTTIYGEGIVMKFANSSFVVPEHVLAREVGGELVILNLDNEQYYGLDEPGTRMWSLLTNSPSIQSAIEMLQAEYDVEREMLEADMDNLIDELTHEGLLEIVSP